MTYHIVVLGDSIQWGQGLNESDKMYTKIKKHVEKKYEITAKVHNFAHSGAKIGWKISTRGRKIHGEVPSTYPTIKQQLEEASTKFGENKDQVKLILMDGGINDVNVRKIINPLTNNSTLKTLSKKYCYRDMKSLLKKVGKTFPNAQIIVTGYFRIISKRSSSWTIATLVAVLGMSFGGIIGGITGIAAVYALKNEMIRQSNLWDRYSKSFLRSAVNEVNRDLETNRIKFVTPRFRAKNAVFAPDNWLFGLNGTCPKDPQKHSRAYQCRRYGQDTKICKIASVGHPNKIGAQKYVNLILPLV